MEAQGLSEGSLRNSHRETHAVRRKPAPAKPQQRASALVESCSQDTVIRQRLDPERVEIPLKKGGFFVLENEGKADPGFLVFTPDQPAVFIQPRGRHQTASTLRLRVSAAVSEGTVLVATLDDVLHSLRLEDVWMWRGVSITDQPFSVRRARLKEFVESHWIPDARLLGGIFTTVAHPISLEAFAAKQDWSHCHSVEFVPEQSGRRRMVHFLEEQQRAATGPAAEKKERAVAVLPVAQIQRPVAGQTVKAVPVDKMPDIYDLFDAAGQLLGRASVQQFALSLRLRDMTTDRWVKIEWREEFNGYEITSLL